MSAVLGGILVGLYLGYVEAYPYIDVVEAKEEVVVEKEVRIEVVVDWTQERIIEEIKKTFPENPDLAVRIARCESGLDAKIQSQHTLSYGQEQSFGVMQVHAPDWADDAERLGLKNWKTDPAENLKLARYIYEKAGNKFTPWMCYTKKMI